jgi:hypothetical protein
LCLRLIALHGSQSTLIETVFIDTLRREEDALNCYLTYLYRMAHSSKHTGTTGGNGRALTDLQAIYRALGRHEDAAICMFELAQAQPTPEGRLIAFKACAAKMAGMDTMVWYHKQVQDKIALMEGQMTVEAADSQLAALGAEPVFQQHPRGNVIGISMSAFVYYCLVYHSRAPRGKLCCPLDLKDAFGLSEKRWTWLYVKARARVRDFEAIKALTLKKVHVRGVGVVH